jgi:hypothetical protein
VRMWFKPGPQKTSVVRLRSDLKEYAAVLADMLCNRLRDMESDKFIATWAWTPWGVHLASLLYVAFAYRFWNEARNEGDHEFRKTLNDEQMALARVLDPKNSWSTFAPIFSDLDRTWWSDLLDLHIFIDGDDMDQHRKKVDAAHAYVCGHFISDEAVAKSQVEAQVMAHTLGKDLYISAILTTVYADIQESLRRGCKMPINKKYEDLRQTLKRHSHSK